MSDHIWLLRRPLPPRGFPPVVKTLPAPRASAGALMPSLLLDQGDAGMRGSSRQEADTPAPRAAPPTPLLPDTSPPLTDRITEGFPCKPPRTRPKNPLWTLLQADTRFVSPPPIFCLSDFLQSQNGARHNSQLLKPEPDRTRPDQTRVRLDQSQTGPDRMRADQSQTGPDQSQTGPEPDRTRARPDRTGPDQTGPDQSQTGPEPDRTRPDRTRPDQIRVRPDQSQTGPDRTSSQQPGCE